MLTDAIKSSIEESVLCWLATSDDKGIPNCSPKEIFTHYGGTQLIIANIASPESVSNIKTNSEVCVSFVHVLKQKGFKLKGSAIYSSAQDDTYREQFTLAQSIAGESFPLKGVIVVEITNAKPIIAPGYIMVQGTTEESQVENAKRAYGLT